MDKISIHAPREGSDTSSTFLLWYAANFNPRSPRGERRGLGFPRPLLHIFQSTLSARGATLSIRLSLINTRISIHALREGSDNQTIKIKIITNLFQSTLSARGAAIMLMLLDAGFAFQSTLSARGAT